MTDLAPLRLRLRRALDISSLLVLGALTPVCAAAPEQDASHGKTEVTKPDAIEPDAIEPDAIEPETTKPELTITATTTPGQDPPTVVGPPDTVDSLPRCPTIDWCGTQTLVEAMRPTDVKALPPAAEGCPRLIQRNEKLDAKLLAGQEPPPAGTMDMANLDVEATKAKRSAGDATSCCYEWTIPCPGGRPLLVDGHPWIAGLRAGHGWSMPLPAAPALGEHVRERIAEGWLRDALTEHASIASFARARAELDAIAAPAELLRACERAAEDEALHARLCFSLAERFSGRGLEPTALPEVVARGGNAIAVALDTFVEGCVGETIAAACARRAAESATDPVVRAVLERIADDETEHAALAWRTIAWLTRREGSRVLAAILEVARELHPGPAAVQADDPDAALLLAHGRLDQRTLARTRALAWRELVEPLLAELGSAALVGPRTGAARPS